MTTPDTAPPPRPERATPLPAALVNALRWLLMLGLPVFLVLTGVRLVMTETFLTIEYRRPGFPADRYGFTQEDRLRYAPYAVRYLLNDAGIEYLGDLTLDGGPMYTDRELRHMADVKVVTRAALAVHRVLAVALGVTVVALAWSPAHRRVLRQGLFAGGTLTIGLIVTIVVIVLLSWDAFFTGFHRVFFEGDSWRFSPRATLIRLFPEQFWFDAAIAIGLLTILGAALAIAVAWLWEARAQWAEASAVDAG